jgi:hypothetical protein
LSALPQRTSNGPQCTLPRKGLRRVERARRAVVPPGNKFETLDRLLEEYSLPLRESRTLLPCKRETVQRVKRVVLCTVQKPLFGLKSGRKPTLAGLTLNDSVWPTTARCGRPKPTRSGRRAFCKAAVRNQDGLAQTARPPYVRSSPAERRKTRVASRTLLWSGRSRDCRQ